MTDGVCLSCTEVPPACMQACCLPMALLRTLLPSLSPPLAGANWRGVGPAPGSRQPGPAAALPGSAQRRPRRTAAATAWPLAVPPALAGRQLGSLLRSSAVLRGAAALEFVAVHATEDQETNWDLKAGEANAFFDWAAQHPPLRRLSYEAIEDPHRLDAGAFGLQLLRLGERRLGLKVWAPGLGGNDPDPQLFLDLIDGE